MLLSAAKFLVMPRYLVDTLKKMFRCESKFFDSPPSKMRMYHHVASNYKVVQKK